jgi:hypothetical protein
MLAKKSFAQEVGQIGSKSMSGAQKHNYAIDPKPNVNTTA